MNREGVSLRTAWEATVHEQRPRLRAMAKEVCRLVPEADGTIALVLPTRFQLVHLPNIQAEADRLAASLSRHLGEPGITVTARTPTPMEDTIESLLHNLWATWEQTGSPSHLEAWAWIEARWRGEHR